MSKAIIDSIAQAMDKTLASLKGDLTKLRTGRASTALIEGVQVEAYGSMVPINQVGNITTPDARTIMVAPWDASTLSGIEKALLAANLGFTPQSDGKVIRIPLPPMTEDRRKDLVKMIKKMGEDAKVAIRNARRDGNEEVKKQEKAKLLSEDEAKKATDLVQKKTDEKSGEVDKIIQAKEKEIMTI